jgi:uncharacterized membrane protein
MQRIASTYLLIAAAAFVFGLFGIDKFANPLLWIGWMPSWMEGFLGLSRSAWLQITGALEILFAIMLCIPIRNVRRSAVILMILHLVAVLTQTGWNDIAIRDIGLLGSLGALFLAL